MKRDLFLVTGANGFVGRAVTDLLVERGKRVRVLIRDAKHAFELEQKGVEVAFGDLRDRSTLTAAVEGVGGIYHIAAIYREAGVPDQVFFDINAHGTRNLFLEAIDAGVERIIHTSTGGVLGHIANPPGNENTPYNPGDVYQRSKVEGEKIALEFYRSGKMRGCVIRPGMIYGPGDTRHLKMFRMIAKRCFFYVGRGDAWVNFIDIRDLARAFLLAMEAEHINGEIYTIANDTPKKLHEVVSLIANELGVPKPWLHLPVKPMQALGTICETVCTPLGLKPPIFRRRVDFFTKSRYFDPSKAMRELGFRPAQPLEKEIKDTIDWYRAHSWL